MPFKSEAQRRLFHVKEDKGEISKATVDEWEHATKNKKKLPYHKHHEKKGAEDALSLYGVKEAFFGNLMGGSMLSKGVGLMGRGLSAASKAVGTVPGAVMGAIGGGLNAAASGTSMMRGVGQGLATGMLPPMAGFAADAALNKLSPPS